MAPEGQDRDRRREPRFPVRMQCWIQQDALTLLGMALNLSRGGVFVRTLPGLAPGSEISLEIGNGDDCVEARGRVVWTAGHGDLPAGSPGVGVVLTEVLSGLDRFGRLLERLSEGPLSD